jgi:hypothetical protein
MQTGPPRRDDVEASRTIGTIRGHDNWRYAKHQATNKACTEDGVAGLFAPAVVAAVVDVDVTRPVGPNATFMVRIEPTDDRAVLARRRDEIDCAARRMQASAAGAADACAWAMSRDHANGPKALPDLGQARPKHSWQTGFTGVGAPTATGLCISRCNERCTDRDCQSEEEFGEPTHARAPNETTGGWYSVTSARATKRLASG